MKKQITILMDESDQALLKDFAEKNRESFSQFLTKSGLMRAGQL